ncbi:DUF3482 domain-containing protein [Alcaligenes faecalis]|uniref:DUF3482 domain-containing protein n=1 Tax=Alcaligenes faecalis TaxID=511 RepID=UPI000F0B4466|nr:DUF3482 domain-containing protein [Alcaligenes faecalis]AYR21086.1 DUF3482 domain-containing protein [Alcaligenes faecalis]
MSAAALTLAVVGHTNTGKTSLLRTLTRDTEFGQISNSPGTTRHVEGARLTVDGQALVELFDTPGLEDSMALLDFMDQLSQPGERIDGPERIRRFLESPAAQGRFEQEARVLRKLQSCDAGLYVVDARDPVLSKHKDELTLLAYSGRPLLPVLNFVRSPQARVQEWRSALARLGLHALAEFDTVAPALDGEALLYDKLAVLLETQAGVLQQLKVDLAQQAVLRRRDAMRLLAELLVDVAAWRVNTSSDTESMELAAQQLKEPVLAREAKSVQALLKRYSFGRQDVVADLLHFDGGRWGMDLFDPQALKEFGVQLGKGVAAGAMAGATLDVMTGGLSLGTGTVLGALAGGLWQGADKWGQRLMGKLRGETELSVDDAVLRLLAVRQLSLMAALERRGHAAQTPIRLGEIDAENFDQALQRELNVWRAQGLPQELAQARIHPAWSTLRADYAPDSRREACVQGLVQRLLGARNAPGANTVGRPQG